MHRRGMAKRMWGDDTLQELRMLFCGDLLLDSKAPMEEEDVAPDEGTLTYGF
jgi:hypothetical protein